MIQSSLRSLEVLSKNLLKYTCLIAVIDDVTDLDYIRMESGLLSCGVIKIICKMGVSITRQYFK